MIETRSVSAYPTPHIAQLLPSVRRNLSQIGRLITVSPVASAPGTESVNYTSVLMVAKALVGAADTALGFFFAYPTQRLWRTLDYLAEETVSMIAWLADRPPAQADAPSLTQYGVCCEHIQRAIREWRLSIRLELAAREIDEEHPETLH